MAYGIVRILFGTLMLVMLLLAMFLFLGIIGSFAPVFIVLAIMVAVGFLWSWLEERQSITPPPAE